MKLTRPFLARFQGFFMVLLCFSLGSISAMQVYWTDVEGGAGTLIVTPAGESILIDTGLPGGRDPGRIHKIATEIAGLKQIDHLIVTHFHLDHFGGAAELSTMMPIRNVWDKGVPDRNPDNRPDDIRFPLLIKPYKEMEVGARHILKPGHTLPLKQSDDGPAISLTCLVADRVMVAAPDGVEADVELCQTAEERDFDTSDNANSIVVLLEFGGFRLFLGGDLTWNEEARLVCPLNRVGEVDVYQVNHHGLDSSNNPVLIRSLAPTVAVMSNGTRKGCGAETFATLKATESIEAIYQIHKNLRDDIENNTADERIANLESDCDANWITMQVARDARSYTLSIPAKGHRQTFQTRKTRF